MKPKLLDLFCCQGGAGMGYHRAGFQVTGVDILGIDWMNRDGLRESIPPAYAEYIGHALMARVMSNRLLEAAA